MAGLHYTIPTKICSCCDQAKPITEFYTQTGTGLPSNQCKECTNIKRSVVRSKARHGKFVSKEKQRSMEAVMFPIKDWQESMLHFRGGCCYCGQKEGRAKADKFDHEHFVALSHGGKTVKNNIAPACRKCNRSRGNKDLWTWFRAQPSYTVEREERIRQWMGG